ncbi:hypothetical protein IHQ68_15575 [Chelatococcus sambhunathii]|uniref:Uncharacterized protein n=1 Tax=Chelatococcus sambhunathii TaxID=363953 RepID=A0ABU1DIU1_9HYPH|nr:hypothetical protein [Chelatococcus sambhunathii]MDR4308042.1 hypothetical protein [Chelatococcus sambhunathii]
MTWRTRWFGAGAAAALILFATSADALAADMAIPAMFGLPSIKLRTIFVGVHLAGLCLGVGGVLVLDALLAKAVFRGVFYAHNRSLVRVLSQTTGLGLILLWASGFAILALYWRDHPELLDNPKIYAKVIIVSALTLNGWLVERFCEPLIHGDQDGPLLVTFSPSLRFLGVASGVFSAVSWYTAAMLGVMRELNGTVPAQTILIGWGCALAFGFAVALTAGLFIERRRLGGSAGTPAGWRGGSLSLTLSDIQLRRQAARG